MTVSASRAYCDPVGDRAKETGGAALGVYAVEESSRKKPERAAVAQNGEVSGIFRSRSRRSETCGVHDRAAFRNMSADSGQQGLGGGQHEYGPPSCPAVRLVPAGMQAETVGVMHDSLRLIGACLRFPRVECEHGGEVAVVAPREHGSRAAESSVIQRAQCRSRVQKGHGVRTAPPDGDCERV